MPHTVSRSPNRPLAPDAVPGRGQQPRPAVAERRPGLDAHAVAVEAAGVAIRLVLKIPAPLRPIADQLVRSAGSVPANIAEGHGRAGRDRMHHWRIAFASAKEVDTHLKLLLFAGAIDAAKAEHVLQLFDRVRAMLWRLLHPDR